MPTPVRSPKMTSMGFTLIEIIVLIVFISIALIGVLSAYSSAMSTSSDPMINIRAIELSQAYLDEILTKRFDENSGQGGTPRCGSTDAGASLCTVAGSFGSEGEARAAFDDIDDYHTLSDNPPVDITGTVRNGYTNYQVDITISYAGSDLSGLANTAAKRIALVVTTPKGDTFNFSAYRVNF